MATFEHLMVEFNAVTSHDAAGRAFGIGRPGEVAMFSGPVSKYQTEALEWGLTSTSY